MSAISERRAKKEARQDRERRYFTTDKNGRRCTVCGMLMAQLEEPWTTHPTCDPSFAALRALAAGKDTGPDLPSSEELSSTASLADSEDAP